MYLLFLLLWYFYIQRKILIVFNAQDLQLEAELL